LGSEHSPVPGVGVQLTALFLRSLRFERLPQNEAPAPTSGELDANIGLGVGRPARDRLNVELSVAFETPGAARVEVTYLAQFRRASDAPAETPEEDYWRAIAAQVAPVVLYPYIRETINSLTGKAGIPSMILPVVNFRAMFDPAEIAIPSFDDEELQPQESAKSQIPAEHTGA